MTLKDEALVMIGDKVSLILMILMTPTLEEHMEVRTQTWPMEDITPATGLIPYHLIPWIS